MSKHVHQRNVVELDRRSVPGSPRQTSGLDWLSLAKEKQIWFELPGLNSALASAEPHCSTARSSPSTSPTSPTWIGSTCQFLVLSILPLPSLPRSISLTPCTIDNTAHVTPIPIPTRTYVQTNKRQIERSRPSRENSPTPGSVRSISWRLGTWEATRHTEQRWVRYLVITATTPVRPFLTSPRLHQTYTKQFDCRQ